MHTQTLFGVLTLGFSLGLLHALDADHIMAVSVLAAKIRPLKSRLLVALTTLRYCMQWAFGHGGILLLLGVLLVAWELPLPSALPIVAEKIIGLFLIAMGGWIIWQLRDNKIKLHVHKHSHDHGNIQHVHLAAQSGSGHNHKPVLIGITHGVAGSAPIFALLPAIGSSNQWLALGYLMLFSGGVLIAMMLFGLFFGQVVGWLDQFGNRLFRIARFVLATVSIIFGSYWLIASPALSAAVIVA